MPKPTTPYIVTDVSGPLPDVGGRIRQPGTTVYLTDAQAEHELSRGVVITIAEAARREAAAKDGADKPEPAEA